MPRAVVPAFVRPLGVEAAVAIGDATVKMLPPPPAPLCLQSFQSGMERSGVGKITVSPAIRPQRLPEGSISSRRRCANHCLSLVLPLLSFVSLKDHASRSLKLSKICCGVSVHQPQTLEMGTANAIAAAIEQSGVVIAVGETAILLHPLSLQ